MNETHIDLSSKNKIQNQEKADNIAINDEEQQDTISDIPAKTMPRPTQRLTRNLSSEMSIECSTTTNHDQNYDLILGETESSEGLSLIEQKVKTVFELPDSETLVNEFPCYLIRLVTLPGWMYVTNRHICFYASLPGKKKGPYKAGYLSKKNYITSPRSYRYYFELRNHVLSWYTSAETKYSPLNSVDLKCITKIEPSKLKKLGIRLTTNKHYHYTIIADSELSQREWMDELRKGVFVAQHAGNSIRIVLPFSKIASVDKPSVFQFTANIKIKFQEDSSEPSSGEDYYFAFFPDIEVTYHEIVATWKTVPDDQKALMIPTAKKNKNASDAITSKTASNSTNFLSFDSFLENVSPAALSTMLMGKLMNVTSLFQQQGSSMNNTSTSDDELSQETWKLKQQSGSSLLNDSKDGDAQLTTSPNEMSTTSLVSRLKRNSLFFSKPSAMTDTNSDEGEAFVTDTLPSQDYFNGTQHQPTENESNRKTRPLSGSYSLSKIPRAVTDAIKHQVIRADNTNSTNSEASSASSDTEQIQVNANDTRSRSSSLSALRHHISPFNLYNKMNNHNLQNVTNSLPHLSTANASMKNNQGDVPINSHQETDFLPTRNDDSAVVSTRKHRAKSMGSMLISGTWHKLALSSGDYYYQQQHLNESQHKHPKGPAWLSNKLIDIIDATWSGNSLSYVEDEEHNENDDSSEKRITSRKMVMDLYIHKDIENPQLKEEEQQTMNDHLDANFPMLLKTEQVEAVLKASFWRTIPYSGRIYITGRYFCFHSKILAGQQKLVVPWQDVIQVNTIKSKSYYLTHAITMIVKDMTDEIYFDFSSIELRDLYFYICQLKCEKFENKGTFDGSSVYSRDSDAGISIGSNIILDRPKHVPLSVEYDGPPLLSSSSILSKPTKKNMPLHFTCLTIGSRGDVQPYIALCKELQKDGHHCRIATHPEYEDWIIGHDIEFRSIGGDPGELMKLCIDNSFLSVSFIREGTKFFYSWFESLLESSYEACQGTDVIIESPSAMVGVHMAEKLEIPYFRSMPFPFTRTTKFPHPFAMQSSAGGSIYNDMTYVMIDMALWASTSKYVNRFRRDRLQLPSTNLDRMELWKVPYIYSFSPTVVHPPKDWPDYIHCTGYWFLDNPDMKWRPDPTLMDFLERKQDKRPIVYIGFGSIIVPDAVETTRIIVDAVLKADVRAIICKGWSARALASNKMSHRKSRSDSDMDQIKQTEDVHEEDADAMLDQHPGTIYHIESVPHDWLFPQIQGVVHHGGAGTTAAGLRAGLPTVIKPFFGDQRFWGQRIEQLQVGICLNKLNKNQLADALKTITQNTTLIAKAQKVGETIQKENGPRNAVESIYREFEFAKDQRTFHSA